MDWPLAANTRYRRRDGASIGLTNANGLFEGQLDNPIADAGAGLAFTGLDDDWRNDNTGWCNDRTSVLNITVSVGNTDIKDVQAAFSGNSDTCVQNLAFYCVQVAP